MVRVLIYLALVAIFAFGAIWVVDRPGELVIDWQGYRIETSVAVAAAFVAIVAGGAVILWNVMRWILAGPEAFALFRRNRRRAKGYEAIARGVVAVGTGDARRAGKEADEARRLLGKEPLTLVLAAQAAQLSGDRAGAEAAFRAMTDQPETRSLGLRGLFIEAERRGDRAQAKQIAEEAARQSPDAPWAGQALFDFQCAEHDWAGALSTLERLSANRLVDKQDARRRRAVLLTAQAGDAAASDAALAIRKAREAHGIAPDFVPASVLAARLLAEQGDPKKAMKIVETTWSKAPHPDLAEIYVHVRTGDPARDKLKRARALSERSGNDPEGLYAVARAALAAREFETARGAIDRLISVRPTVRACMLMAELEEIQNDAGRSREWLARALRAPRDSAWVADGVASEIWAPTSPVTGRLDAFVWKMPVEETRPKLAADAWLDQAPAEMRPLEAAATPALPREMPALSDPADAPEPEPPSAPPKPATVIEAKPTAAPALSLKATPAPARPTATVFPLSRAPDDPGTNGAEPADTASGGQAFPPRAGL
jgi:HemY protein